MTDSEIHSRPEPMMYLDHDVTQHQCSREKGDERLLVVVL